jgi:hypothetical protein
VVESDKRQRMEELGLAEGSKPYSAKSLEEKKQALLSRLLKK